MTLQREYRQDGKLVWRDVVKGGQVVKSSVDIDALPFGVYRLENSLLTLSAIYLTQQ